jgi:hypothetical protein
MAAANVIGDGRPKTPSSKVTREIQAPERVHRFDEVDCRRSALLCHKYLSAAANVSSYL